MKHLLSCFQRKQIALTEVFSLKFNPRLGVHKGSTAARLALNGNPYFQKLSMPRLVKGCCPKFAKSSSVYGELRLGCHSVAFSTIEGLNINKYINQGSISTYYKVGADFAIWCLNVLRYLRIYYLISGRYGHIKYIH